MKKDKRKFILEMNRGGELIQDSLHRHTINKYKPDSFILKSPVSYFLMIACVIIDIAFFRSLFVKISYDSPMMIILETAGLAFAADIVAAYAGILAKRIKQGLSRDKLNLYLLISVPIFALLINGILRFATMGLDSIDGTIDAATIALTIIAIVTPIFTSIGNFAISFQSYDPLGQKMCREEMAIDSVKDECRRLQAIEEECDDFDAEKLKEIDRQHLINAKKELINDALMLYADIRVKMMEYLGDPTSTNVLSQPQCDAFFDRLYQELKALQSASANDLQRTDV